MANPASQHDNADGTTTRMTLGAWRHMSSVDRAANKEAFQGAVRDLVAYGKQAKAAGIDEETPEFVTLNARVNELWPTVPAHVRVATYHWHAPQYEDEAE
jgi:hypothetical protein